MKTNTNFSDICTYWCVMLEQGKIPVFEIELKDNEYLLVDLELNVELEEIRFSFDSMNLKTWFSGSIKSYNENHYALPITEYDDSLDALLELVYQELSEGFILPNGLYPTE